MIDVHVNVNRHGITAVQLGFTLAGEPFDPGKAETREFRLDKIIGPLLKMDCRDGSLLMWKDGCDMGGCSHFHGSSVTQLFWLDRNTIQFLSDRGVITAEIRGIMETMSKAKRPGGKPAPAASSMLMTAMLRGATLTPFYDQTPMDRLFRTAPPVLAGYTLVLPDSPDRHLLGVDDGDLPVLNADARQAVDRFLSK